MPPRLAAWRIVRDRSPLRMPSDGDTLATVLAESRDDARRQAEQLFPGRPVVVLAARAWPTRGPRPGTPRSKLV